MSDIQKIIKYLSIAFAIFLIFSITSGFLSGLLFISNIFDNKNDYEKLDDLKELNIEDNVNVLDINIESTSIIIKIGEVFKVETSNKYIECKKEKNMVFISERKHNWFNINDKNVLVIYIPKNMILDGVSINSGAGNLKIDQLSTKIINLDLGAGKVNINNLNVLNTTKINGGVGKLTINNSILNNLDLDMGVGKFIFTGKILGKTEIEHGIGAIKLNLLGTKDEYQINLDKGIGSVKVDGNHIKNDEIIGNGNNRIYIDGGVGSINFNFINEKYVNY